MPHTLEQNILDKYEPTIGLEIHVQLDTKSKMFCRCDNNSEEVSPNTNVCEVCMGYPGTLPVANAQAMEFGARLAAAIGCTINPFQRFDRKNYFYPDLPKGYQISQFFYPVGEHGQMTVDYLAPDRKSKLEFQVGITRLHLEEDAGKLTHTPSGSLVDLNRCGTPLAEIVTGPDIHSPEQAKAFMQELQRIVRKLGVSRADMEKGHMRVDGNISVRLKGAAELGGKVEIKNINSFKFLEQALAFEIARQVQLLEKGEKINQETRGWDEKSGTTVSQRLKEGSVDYRYFPDPDLPPTSLDDDLLVSWLLNMPELPRKLRLRAEDYGLPYDRVCELQDKELIHFLVGVFDDFADSVEKREEIDVVQLANYLSKGYSFASSVQVLDFFKAVKEHNMSSTMSEKLLLAMAPADRPLAELAAEIAAAGVDEGALEQLVREVLAANPNEVSRYKAGETKLIGFFVGQLMARAAGAADPGQARAVIERVLTEA